mgnify:CR=1 FL=1
MTEPRLQLAHITKRYPAVVANDAVSLTVQPGEIHAVLGENGAGKSTLMSILYGFYRADSGEIFINGNLTAIPDSQSAIRAGIGMVFQHFKLVQNFTVLENVVLGVEDGAHFGFEAGDVAYAEFVHLLRCHPGGGVSVELLGVEGISVGQLPDAVVGRRLRLERREVVDQPLVGGLQLGRGDGRVAGLDPL